MRAYRNRFNLNLAVLAVQIALPAALALQSVQAFAAIRPAFRPTHLDQTLFQALENNQLSEMSAALSQGADPNHRNKKALFAPILLRAIANGNARAVSLLISAGAKVDATDHRGTPILIAAISLAAEHQTKIIDAIEALIVRGHANPNARDTAYVGDDRSALHAAAASGSLRLVKLLLAAGANPNQLNRHHESALHFAAEKGHSEIAQELLNWGTQIDQRSKYTPMTPLMAASENGHFQTVHLLLQNRARQDLKNAFGKNSIELAKAKLGRAPAARSKIRYFKTVQILESRFRQSNLLGLAR